MKRRASSGWTLILTTASAFVAGACDPTTLFWCSDAAECTRGSQAGVCEASGFCSFPDSSCLSGRRYGGLADEELAQSCVDAGEPNGDAEPGDPDDPTSDDPAPDDPSPDDPSPDDPEPGDETPTSLQWQLVLDAPDVIGPVRAPNGAHWIAGTLGPSGTLGEITLDDPEATRGFVAKVESGTVTWARLLGSGGPTHPEHIAVSGNSVTVAGRSGAKTLGGLAVPVPGNIAFVVELDTGGNGIALATLVGGPPTLAGLAADPDNGGTLLLGTNPTTNPPLILYPYDEQWQHFMVHTASNEVAWGPVLYATGRLTTTGVDAASDLVITGTYEDGATILNTPLPSTGDTDAFVFAQRANPWARTIRGIGRQNLRFARQLSDASIIVAGTYDTELVTQDLQVDAQGSVDVFVARLQADGALDWLLPLGGPGPEELHGLDVTAEGEIVLTGAHAGQLDLGEGPIEAMGSVDAFVVRLDADGVPTWSRTVRSSSSARALGVTFDGPDAVVLTVELSGQADLGDGTVGTQNTLTTAMVGYQSTP